MNITDIVALARAGYNVQQINAIISMMGSQPAQAQQQPMVQQPMQQPMVQQMQQPAQQMQQMQQPVVQQMQQPAQQMQQMQQPVVQQMQQPVVQQMQQPMVQQMQQPAQEGPVLAQLRALTGAIQQNNIFGTQQPAQRSAEDIVASIINPEAAKEV